MSRSVSRQGISSDSSVSEPLKVLRKGSLSVQSWVLPAATCLSQRPDSRVECFGFSLKKVGFQQAHHRCGCESPGCCATHPAKSDS